MAEVLTLANLGDLAVLIFLQAVLGFDNLLYISLESKRAPAAQQGLARQLGIIVAVVLRVVLLFVIIELVARFADPFVSIDWVNIVEGSFNLSSVVFLGGGVFIIYTAVKEISHMLVIEDLEALGKRDSKSLLQVVALIVAMNLVFSFDSILSAMAISKVFWVLAAAIIVSGVLMLLLASHVATFLTRNRKYEVLGLFILLIVGVVLLGEGGEAAHLKLAGHAVEPMSKSTFYFSVGVLVVVDMVQSRYQKKLATERARPSVSNPQGA